MTGPLPAQPSKRPELDELTVRRAQRGEALACRALVERHQVAVFALLSRLLRPGGLASSVEDLAQEAFLRVFRELPSFSLAGPARLSSWILTIAARVGIDALRARSRRVSPMDVEELGLAHEGPGADAAAEQKRLGRAIERAMA